MEEREIASPLFCPFPRSSDCEMEKLGVWLPHSIIVVVQSLSCVWLCELMHCSTPDLSVSHYLLEFAQVHGHWICDAIQPSHPLLPSSPFAFKSFPASESFPMSLLFTSGGQSIRASASASILLMNIQGWFPLELTGLISLLSKGLWRVFSSTTIWKHQFFSVQPSLWSNSYIQRHYFAKKGETLLCQQRSI